MHGTLYIVEGVHNTPVYVGKLVSDGEKPNIHKILMPEYWLHGIK